MKSQNLSIERLRYAAYLTVSYRRKCLGCYETAEEAYEAYKAAAQAHFGEFARV